MTTIVSTCRLEGVDVAPSVQQCAAWREDGSPFFAFECARCGQMHTYEIDESTFQCLMVLRVSCATIPPSMAQPNPMPSDEQLGALINEWRDEMEEEVDRPGGVGEFAERHGTAPSPGAQAGPVLGSLTFITLVVVFLAAVWSAIIDWVVDAWHMVAS